jgi:MFS family permease
LKSERPAGISAADEFRRGWKIILVAAIGLGCGLSALPIYSLGALTKPLSAAMGWTRAETQWIYTWMTLGNLVAAPALGWFLDRGGVRRVTLWSIALMSIGLASLGWITGPLWSFYLVAFITAIVGVATTPITWTRSVVDWFEVGRGRALGLALAGTGVSAMFIPSYTVWLIHNIGWRWAYIGLAALPAFVALPIAFFMLRDRPAAELAAERAAARGDTISGPPSAPIEEMGFVQAIKGYQFWVMSVVFLVVGAGVAGLIATLLPFLTDRGVSSSQAALLSGVGIGLSVIIGRIGTGYLIDRFWAPGVAAIILSLPAVSCLVLASGVGGLWAAGFSAVLIGLAAGAEFDLMAFLVSRYFAQRRYGILYSCLYAIFKVGAGIGAPIFGYSFDFFGSYVSVLYAAAASLVGASLLLLVLGPYVVRGRTGADAAAEAVSLT